MPRSHSALAENTARKFTDRELHVLVVEDNAINQKVAVTLLEKLGIHADVASNGKDGVIKLRARPYDEVFMDCQMPEMNGHEATDHIRLAPGPNQHVSIIAMTAQVIEGSRER